MSKKILSALFIFSAFLFLLTSCDENEATKTSSVPTSETSITETSSSQTLSETSSSTEEETKIKGIKITFNTEFLSLHEDAIPSVTCNFEELTSLIEFSYEVNSIYTTTKPKVEGLYNVKATLKATNKYDEVSTVKNISLVRLNSIAEIKAMETLTICSISGKVIYSDQTATYIQDETGAIYIENLINQTFNDTLVIIGSYAPANRNYTMECMNASLINTSSSSDIISEEIEISDLIKITASKDNDSLVYSFTGEVAIIDSKVYVQVGSSKVLIDNEYSVFENKTVYAVIILRNTTTGLKRYIALIEECELSMRAILQNEALLLDFTDLTNDSILPTSLESGTEITYLSTSNSKIINITNYQVTQSGYGEKTVTLKIKLTREGTSITFDVTAIVLKGDASEKKLMIYSIEMHQQYGDSTYIKYGDFDMLIDAGDSTDGAYVKDFVLNNLSDDGILDVLSVTHCHSDHMGGLLKALEAVPKIGLIIDYGHDRTGNTLHTNWVEKRNTYINAGATYYSSYNASKNLNKASSRIVVDEDLYIDILDTNVYKDSVFNATSSSPINDYSTAMLLTFNDFRFFFAGDLEDSGENGLIANAKNTELKNIVADDTVLYKAAHHGTNPSGNTATSSGGNKLPLLNIIKPDYVYISSAMAVQSGGERGSQLHPHALALANFLRFTEEIYFNGTMGTITMETDGSVMNSITGAGQTSNYTVNGVTPSIIEKNYKLIDTTWYKYYRKTDVDNYLK